VLEGCQDILEAFGGHELAAGFTVKQENILALAQRIRAQVALQADRVHEPELEIDALLDDPAVLDLRGVELLERLEPYGTGNPRTVLALYGMPVMSRSLVGNGRHLKLKLSKQNVTLDAIFFSAAGRMPELGSRIDVAFYPQINEYRGTRMVQLQLVDLRQTASRAQMERELLDKYRRGDALTGEEARALLPEREEFVALWHYLKRETATRPLLEDTLVRIARGAGRREPVLHTLVCLDVMHERGLIALENRADRVRITLNQTQGKVDLEDSYIMRRLRQVLEEI